MVGWSVMQKRWVSIFKVKVTVRAYNQNMTGSNISSELMTLL